MNVGMMRYFWLVLYSLLLVMHGSFAEDAKEVAKPPALTTPDVVALPPNWWTTLFPIQKR